MWNRSPNWPPSSSEFDAPPGSPPRDPAAIGPAADPYQDGQWAPSIAPVETFPENDQIRSESYVPPYRGPGELDDYGRETDEMRRAYDDLHRKEPTVRAAIDGKAGAVACLDLSWHPRDKSKPNDVAAAKFVKEQIDDLPTGADGLILNILRPGLVRGFSIGEKVQIGVEFDGGPMWGLLHVKSKDTQHLRLRLDAYRNVTGIVNTVRGIRTHDPGKVILFTHMDMYDNPFGQSDLRAAYRNANLINDAYKLWHIGLQLWGQPFLKGKVKEATRRKQMETALKSARGAGFIVYEDGDDVDILNFATATSFDAFEKKVSKCREDIFLAVRGAYLPFLEGSGGPDSKGDTDISKKVGSDPVEYLLAKAVGRCLTHQLAPDLVIPNFPPGTGIPIGILGGVGWDETLKQLEVAEKLQTVFGLKTSAKHLYEISQMPPPTEGDTPPGPQQPGGGPGGNPAALGGGPAPTPAKPEDPAVKPSDPKGDTLSAASAPASAFPREKAAQYASYFAGSQHGHYPGDMHEQFGMDVPAFADLTKLLRKQVRRGGEASWVWAKRPDAIVDLHSQPTIPAITQTFSALSGAKFAGRDGLTLKEVRPGVHRWVKEGGGTSGGQHEVHPETGEHATVAAAKHAMNNPEQYTAKQHEDLAKAVESLPDEQVLKLHEAMQPEAKKVAIGHMIKENVGKAIGANLNKPTGTGKAGDEYLAKLLSEIPGHAERQKAKGLWDRMGDAVGNHMASHPVATAIASIPYHIIDLSQTTAGDIEKNPALMGKYGASGGHGADVVGDASAAQAMDSLGISVGIPGSIAMKLVSGAIAAGISKLKSMIGGPKMAEGDDEAGYTAAAKVIAGIVNAALESAGLEPSADVDAIGKYLREGATPRTFAADPTEDAPDSSDTIAQALLDYAIAAKDAGEDPAAGLDYIREHIDDPALLERFSGAAIFAWSEDAHPRGKGGHFIAKGAIEAAKGDPEKAKQLREQVSPRDAAKLDKLLAAPVKGPTVTQKRAVAKDRGKAILDKLGKASDLKGKFTADDLHALADHLSDPAVTVAHLREIRQAMRANALQAGYGGAKRKDDMAKALVEHARGHAFEARLKEHGITGEAADDMRRAAGRMAKVEPVQAPAPPEAKPAGTAKEPEATPVLPTAEAIESATKTPLQTEGGTTGGSAKSLYTVEVGGKKFLVKSAAKGGPVGTKNADTRANAEQLSSELAKQAGVNVPDAKVVEIKGEPHVVSAWVDGVPLSQNESLLKSVKPGEVSKMALFDYATGQVDNHLGNYLVGKDGSLHGIDREVSLGAGGEGDVKDMSFNLDENKLLQAAAGGSGPKVKAMALPPDQVKHMAAVAATIPGKLEGKAAQQASDRATVLKKLSELPSPTVGDLMRLSDEHKSASEPSKPDDSLDMGKLLDQPADSVAPGTRTGDAVAAKEKGQAKRSGTPGR